MASADIKVVLIGQKNVGKTACFNRLIYNDCPTSQMTIGAYFAVKNIGGREVAIWDTAGEEKFDSLTSYYCKGAHAALVCYDLTNLSSFQKLSHWLEKIQTQADDDCVITILGNKLDIVQQNPETRAVQHSQAKEFAKSINAEIFEVSAKSGEMLTQAFENTISRLINASGNKFDKKPKGVVLQHSRQKKPCCR